MSGLNTISGLATGGLACGVTAALTNISPVAGFTAGFTFSYLGGITSDESLISFDICQIAMKILASAVAAKAVCLAVGSPLTLKGVTVVSGIALGSGAAVILLATVAFLALVISFNKYAPRDHLK